MPAMLNRFLFALPALIACGSTSSSDTALLVSDAAGDVQVPMCEYLNFALPCGVNALYDMHTGELVCVVDPPCQLRDGGAD